MNNRAHPVSQVKAVKEPSLSSLWRTAIPYKHLRENDRRESTAEPKGSATPIDCHCTAQR